MNRPTSVRTHYDQVILPIWSRHGFNRALSLPYESVNVDGSVNATRYRAMACARQLYVFTESGDQAHADILFGALLRHFRDRDAGGFFYSIDAEGAPLDVSKDLYTHAFVVFACAAYFARFNVDAARDAVIETADVIARRFPRDEASGLSVAAASRDFVTTLTGLRQNPLMHLTEAYLGAADATRDHTFDTALASLLEGVSRVFIDPHTHCVMELPALEPASWIEPGHQFEWLFLSRHTSRRTPAPHPAFVATGMATRLEAAFTFAQHHGVDAHNGGVAATLDRAGQIVDPTQRIWAQTEYLRALAVHPDAAQRARLSTQLPLFEARFLHEYGWHECLLSDGTVSRADMPSTTPYHLISSYITLV